MIYPESQGLSCHFLGFPKGLCQFHPCFFWICDMVGIYLVPFAFPVPLPSYMSKNHERFWPKAMFPYFGQTTLVGMPCTIHTFPANALTNPGVSCWNSSLMILLNGRASISPGPERGLVGWSFEVIFTWIFLCPKMGCLGGSKWCREEATNSWFDSFELWNSIIYPLQERQWKICIL